MSAIGIISLNRTGDGEPANSAGDKIIAGAGQGRVRNAFTDATGQFHTGHWQGLPGIIRVNYTESELCVILKGRVCLTDAQDGSVEHGPGDAFVVASGFTGMWENIGEVTKIYAIFERKRL